jgi:hypothetical protein
MNGSSTGSGKRIHAIGCVRGGRVLCYPQGSPVEAGEAPAKARPSSKKLQVRKQFLPISRPASAGSGLECDSAPTYKPDLGHRPERPPLASQLFIDKPRFAVAMRNFSEFQPLVPYLRHPPDGVGVEQLLQKYQEEASSDERRYQQLAAIRYYLQRILGSEQQSEWDSVHGGVTNYKTLLEELRHWRLSSGEKVCLVTFNYDTMLEAASGILGVHIQNISDYVSNETCKIIKLHGFMAGIDSSFKVAAQPERYHFAV